LGLGHDKACPSNPVGVSFEKRRASWIWPSVYDLLDVSHRTRVSTYEKRVHWRDTLCRVPVPTNEEHYILPETASPQRRRPSQHESDSAPHNPTSGHSSRCASTAYPRNGAAIRVHPRPQATPMTPATSNRSPISGAKYSAANSPGHKTNGYDPA